VPRSRDRIPGVFHPMSINSMFQLLLLVAGMPAEAQRRLGLILGVITPAPMKFPAAQIQYQTDRKHGYADMALSTAPTSLNHTIPVSEFVSGLEMR